MEDIQATHFVGAHARRARWRSISRLIVAAGLLIGAGFVCKYLWFSRPIGNGPAGSAIPHQMFVQPWTSKPVFLVGVGDSVTAGFGARRGYGYFDRLVTNPADEFPEMKGICLAAVLPHLQSTNLAVSGSVSKELAESQLPRLPPSGQAFGLVVITTGGNDLIHNYGRTPPREHAMYGATLEEAKPWIDNFERRLETIISNTTARFSRGCHIFLANIYDPTDGVGDIQHAGLPAWRDGGKILEEYNRVIQRCCDRHPDVHLINLHDAFLGHGIHCTQFWRRHYESKDPHYWYYENLEDPNERGYDAIRRLFLLEMAKLFKQF